MKNEELWQKIRGEIIWGTTLLGGLIMAIGAAILNEGLLFIVSLIFWVISFYTIFKR